MKVKNWKLLISAIVLCQLAGVTGSFFTVSSLTDWYAGLNKPAFNPPNGIFGPVWITLYTLMGISLYLVWEKHRQSRKFNYPLMVFCLQLVLNLLWSMIFFGFKNLGLAFGEIIILFVLIAYVIKLFKLIDKLAAWLLVPYLLWVGFAALLNFSIWQLN